MNRTSVFRVIFPPAMLAVLLVFATSANVFADNQAHDRGILMQHLKESLQLSTPGGDPDKQPASPAWEPGATGRTADGFLHYIGTPPSHHFPVKRAVPGKPAVTAQHFLKDNAELLAPKNARMDFVHIKSKKNKKRYFEKFDQIYADVPVFGAKAIVQLNESGGVEALFADIGRQFDLFDDGTVSLSPSLSAKDAVAAARVIYAQEEPDAVVQATDPVLMIYDPAVLGHVGEVHLVWYFESADEPFLRICERTLVDAHDGELVERISLKYEALYRKVYDAENSSSSILVRAEGDPLAEGRDEANWAYYYLGDTYLYYDEQFSRDSYDNHGMTLNATVRYCPPGETCPWSNAWYHPTNDWLSFGEGYVTDDVVAHEFTHVVTHFESGLFYQDHSGAINESLSDIFGEFVDLTNGRGNDDPGVRWYMVEDLGRFIADGCSTCSMRRMDDPTLKSHPDKLSSEFFIPVGSADDHGGVHTNSGVGNKLCYLLSDGDVFNGKTITGVGIDRVAAIFYQVNAYLLGPASDYYDLHYALRQAAVNLGWTTVERNNLYRACSAVEIVKTRVIYVDWTGDIYLQDGSSTFPYRTVNRANQEAWPGDHIIIRDGSYNETLIINEVLVIERAPGATVTIGR